MFETREKTVDYNVTDQRKVHKTQDTFETRDVYETQDIFETRDIIETRLVYEDQPIYETHVTGTRDLSGYASISAAGIDTGADLSLQVRSSSSAAVKFVSSTKISVTVDGSTTNFTFASGGGDWRNGLLTALNSISGLTADYTTDGKLHLTTSDAQSLTISDIPNQILDFSGSPLGSLGLTAGTTEAAVVGYEQVQVGTEDVVVGTEDVWVGTEDVLVGTEDVKVGTEQVFVRTDQVRMDPVKIAVGYERVVVGVEREPSHGSSRDGASIAASDRAALRSSLAALHQRLSDLTSLQLGGGSGENAAKGLEAVLNVTDARLSADVVSLDAVDDGLTLIDAAEAHVDAIATYLGSGTPGATPHSIVLEVATSLDQTRRDALLYARALAAGWHSNTNHATPGSLLSNQV